MVKRMTDQEKVIHDAALAGLEELSILLESDSEIIDSMSIEDVTIELRKMGLDPNRPLIKESTQLAAKEVTENYNKNRNLQDRSDYESFTPKGESAPAIYYGAGFTGKTKTALWLLNRLAYAAPKKFLSNISNKEPESIAGMYHALYEHGRNRALTSSVIDSNQDDLHILEEHARAVAQEAHRDIFNPSEHLHDQIREQEFYALCDRRKYLEQERESALAAIWDYELRLAGKHPIYHSIKPAKSTLLLAVYVVIFCISSLPTLLDLLSFIGPFSWVLAILSSISIGLFIVLTANRICVLESSDKRFPPRIYGGALMLFGLLILRLTNSTSLKEIVITAGLSFMETGALISLSVYSAQLRDLYKQWVDYDAEHSRMSATIEVKRMHLAAFENELKNINDEISRFIRYVEERSIRHFKIEDIIATSSKCVLDGYADGIAMNRGRLQRNREKKAHSEGEVRSIFEKIPSRRS